MAVITIDGIKLDVPENKNVLDCALENGIYIPHLCHHKDLSPLGSCRMCVVEVEGQEGVTTSCTLKAKDGMVIKTKTAELERLRMLALELLLTGHPEDCSTCPKYGNCELQMLIQYIGPKTGRLKMRTKGFRPQEDNPLIIHDMNRCVLCGRCVRACNELRGVKVLQYQKKDMETYVGTVHNKLLKDADCRFCGACAEVCPTGTIRDKLMNSEVKREDAIVPCRHACPAHTDIPRYIRHVKNGEYDEAVAVIREKVPFPKALGYICTHVCELECKRKEVNLAEAFSEPADSYEAGSYVSINGTALKKVACNTKIAELTDLNSAKALQIGYEYYTAEEAEELTVASAENGVIRVLSEKDCIVTETEKRLTASRKQSCGKCVFCREGLLQLQYMQKEVKDGKGKAEFIDMTKEIGEAMTYSTPCSMGQNSSRIALTAVEKFAGEYEAHIKKKNCPAGVCFSTETIYIDPKLCDGCGECMDVCPKDCIEGKSGYIHMIDEFDCDGCGKCMGVCEVEAIIKTSGKVPKLPNRLTKVGRFKKR